MACTCGPGQQCQPLKPGCWGYGVSARDDDSPMTADDESHGAAMIGIIEKHTQENAALRAENQRLRERLDTETARRQAGDAAGWEMAAELDRSRAKNAELQSALKLSDATIIDSRRLETAANEVARIWPAYRLYHDQNYVALCQAMRSLESELESDNAQP